MSWKIKEIEKKREKKSETFFKTSKPQHDFLLLKKKQNKLSVKCLYIKRRKIKIKNKLKMKSFKGVYNIHIQLNYLRIIVEKD